jgi:membrane-associated phospholipid phosphatase
MHKKRYADFLLLALWGLAIFLYFLTGRVIPAESRHLVWCRLDDYVPFLPVFAIPYVAWYAVQAFTACYCFFKDTEVFRKFVGYILFVYAIAISVYLFYPTAIDFRPEVTGKDIFSRIVGLVYGMDNPTNVLPSLHVLVAVGCAFAQCRAKHLGKPLLCVFWWLIALFVCASTVLVKQHSVLDILGAIPVCVAGYVLFFAQNGKFVDIAEES